MTGMIYSAQPHLSRTVVYPLLLIVVCAGLTLRTWTVNFDQGVGSHPDERWTTCFIAPRMALPQSWDEFLDPQRSPLNPLWKPSEQTPEYYSYGHFPMYLGVLMGSMLHDLAPLAEKAGVPAAYGEMMRRASDACGGIAVAGRLVIALLDTLTIVLVYLLGRRIAGRGVGLLAATFYAFTAQAIQLSHFFAMDPASTTFTVLTVLGGVMLVQERSWRAVIVMGVGAGLAISSKFSALPILSVPIVAAILVFLAESARARATGLPADGRGQFVALAGMFVAILIAAVAFAITSPYAVLDWQTFIEATLVRQGSMVRGIADLPYTRQYRNTTPYLYFIQQQVAWGLWWPLGLLALAGTGYAAVEMVRGLWWLLSGGKRPIAEMTQRVWLGAIVVWSWVLPYFGLTGAFMAKFNRYISPLLPFVVLFGALLIGWLWAGWQSRNPEVQESKVAPSSLAWIRRGVAVILVLIGVGGGIFWSAAYVHGVYNSEHPWMTGTRWLFENAPPGSIVLTEAWDDEPLHSIPGEPGMDRGSRGITTSKWGPYEEDTREKYEILKAALREADYVYYSSKRIYDSVDELPRRYPMTIRYYEGMWSGELGYELALDVSTPPKLFGFTFEDRGADESWSLYDHPQVTIFRKVRDLSDAEFDAVFDRAWEKAVPWDRGDGTILSPLLDLAGLGSAPDSEDRGLINVLIRMVTGREQIGLVANEANHKSLLLEELLDKLPVVDNYRWNRTASESPWLAVAWWWLVVALLGWVAWPISFAIFRPLRDRGYLLSRALGWLLAAWLLWLLASVGWALNTVMNAWLTLALLALIGFAAAIWQWRALRRFVAAHWGLLLVSEALFAVAYLFFILIRMVNPDIWQPWFGGEKFMEFAFLNGILRSPTFPPIDPHFAGGYINYYYFGIYLVAYLIKLTGIYAEVAFNLAIPTLFALTVVNAFAVAYSALTAPFGSRIPLRTPHWTRGLLAALLAPFFVVLMGNLDGFAQVVRSLASRSSSTFESALPGVQPLVRAAYGLYEILRTGQSLPPYDFWGPSRVIPFTINEFPYWSFLYADLHPHMIGIPFAALFLALILALFLDEAQSVRGLWGWGLLLLPIFGLMLGTMAVVNLWELPTYAGLGLLAFVVVQFRRQGHVNWVLTIGVAVLYLALAYLFYWPFFTHFATVIVGGVGLVRTPDEAGTWLLIWGLMGFVLVSWLIYAAGLRARREARDGRHDKPTGAERWLSLVFRRFDRLPRLVYLHQRLVRTPSLAYLASMALGPALALVAVVLWWWGQTVLALCLLPLGLAFLLLWRRGQAADPATLFVALLTVTGLAILAGTQLIYLKDHLVGGDWYRMNTLFKFFNQVWVLWGMAAAIALPRLWRGWISQQRTPTIAENAENAEGAMLVSSRDVANGSWAARIVRWGWSSALIVMVLASCAYLVWGTPARLDQRLVGWRPDFGTLNGMVYMEKGVYTWQRDPNSPLIEIELAYDYEAIRWLLDNVRGNAIIVESSEVDYYRAGGTRAATMTGLSGLRGLHAGEQRYQDELGPRDSLHREFWTTPDIWRTEQIINDLNVSFVYVGQLERYLHPEGAQKMEQMAAEGWLVPLFRNDGVTIYGVADRLATTINDP